MEQPKLTERAVQVLRVLLSKILPGDQGYVWWYSGDVAATLTDELGESVSPAVCGQILSRIHAWGWTESDAYGHSRMYRLTAEGAASATAAILERGGARPVTTRPTTPVFLPMSVIERRLRDENPCTADSILAGIRRRLGESSMP